MNALKIPFSKSSTLNLPPFKLQPTSEMLQARLWQNSSPSNYNSFNNNSFNNNNSSNTISNNTISFTHVSNVNNYISAAVRAEILASLSPLDPWIRHPGILDDRVEHVGDLLLPTKEYRSWLAGEPNNSALFCYGDPGVGKTNIT